MSAKIGSRIAGTKTAALLFFPNATKTALRRKCLYALKKPLKIRYSIRQDGFLKGWLSNFETGSKFVSDIFYSYYNII
jgi:hypothetical protein